MKLKLIVLMGSILLFGCSTNQKFDCPYKNGIRCQRLSEIDKEVDAGTLQIWVAPHPSMINIAIKPAKRINDN